MYTKDDVTNLVAALGKYTFEPAVELGEPHAFGLGLELFDPVTGQIITVARPHRSDIGEEEIFRTAEQVAAAVAQGRANRAALDRARGYGSPEEATAAAARLAEERALAAKHQAEMDELRAKQAEKLAADSAPARDRARAAKEQAAKDQASADAAAAAAASATRSVPHARPRA